MDLAAAVDALLRGSYLMSPDELPELVLGCARHLGATEAVLYLVDYGQDRLTPLLPDGVYREAVSVDGSLAGRAFWTVTPQTVGSPDGQRVWVPVLDGIERLGVLELALPAGPEPPTGDWLRAAADLAHLVGELLTTNRTMTDVYEWSRRKAPMSLSAELQHAVLPPLTFGTEQFVISGLLAPAYEVGGDAFDYALNGHIAHLAILDAIGHGLDASLLATLATTCLRNGRRAGLDLPEMARLADATIAGRFGAERFVTAVLAQLDVDTGRLRWLSAGHPEPLLLREGQVVKELHCEPMLPLGLNALRTAPDAPAHEAFPVAEEALQPGDRLLLVTDGVDEARTEAGEFFGRERLAAFAAREAASGLPTPEVLRRLHQAFLRHQTGRLQDDATTVLVEWRTGGSRRLTGDAAVVPGGGPGGRASESRTGLRP